MNMDFYSPEAMSVITCPVGNCLWVSHMVAIGPVARVGPTEAGPRQKSLGPRQKISPIMFKSNTFLRSLHVMGYSLYYEPDTGWIFYDFSLQMNRRNITFSSFVSNQGCKIKLLRITLSLYVFKKIFKNLRSPNLRLIRFFSIFVHFTDACLISYLNHILRVLLYFFTVFFVHQNKKKLKNPKT